MPCSRFLVGSVVLVATACCPFAVATTSTPQNVPVEITFHAARNHADPFNDVTLDVVFTDPRGLQWRVPAFWDGGSTWKVRYASPRTGKSRYRTICSDPLDRGLEGREGTVLVTPYVGSNPLYRHGPIRVADDNRHLAYGDGTPFFWLGDTWWMGLARRLRFPDEFQALTRDRVAKGFNVVQIVAGLYPDMFPFDPRGANEAGFPWEANYARINPAYFDQADKRLRYLTDRGISPCIVGSWGYFMRWMSVDQLKRHWRNLIARYGAMPVVWCGCGEVDMPWYLAKRGEFDRRDRMRRWTEVVRYIHRADPFHRLVTLHPDGYSARDTIDDASLLDFDMLQTGHGEEDTARAAVAATATTYGARPSMPFVDGEASYEMLNDSMPTAWTRAMFWISMLDGAAGHTYGANGIWQNNRPNDPHGKSPYGGTWGKIPSSLAMHLPGSSQVAYGKALFEKYPWMHFQPHPEWAAYQDENANPPPGAVSLGQSHWIWYPEGNPAVNASVGARYFRLDFEVPDGKSIADAAIRFNVDDAFVAYLNGQRVASSSDWRVGAEVKGLGPCIKPGRNVLAIRAENLDASVAQNPAGLIGAVVIHYHDGSTKVFASDGSWRAAKTVTPDWKSADFDDGAWPAALVVASYGDAPWGRFAEPRPPVPVLSAGIPNRVRFTYALLPRPVEEVNLGAWTIYKAKVFDPVSGVATDLGLAVADEDGRWIARPPAGWDHDRVIILEPVHGTKEGLSNRATKLDLQNGSLRWQLDWSSGHLRTGVIENRLSGHRFLVSQDREISLTFSGAVDRISEPVQTVAEWKVSKVTAVAPNRAVVELVTQDPSIRVALHYELDGQLRRKWAEVENVGKSDRLLLDVCLDDLTTDGSTAGGGLGQPVLVDGELFAAIEHPAGDNEAGDGHVRLSHHPGRVIRPGSMYRSFTAIVGAAPAGHAQSAFVRYIQSRSLRPKRDVAVFTPFGINNQWGGAPSLDDEETLDVLNLVGNLQKQSVTFDYFTLDTGWVDSASDLTQFRAGAYPDGPGAIVRSVERLRMNFGLWFAMEWGAQSAWNYPGAYASGIPAQLPYKEGYPQTLGGISFCLGTKRYYDLLKSAVLYHVRTNHVRLLKFDGGVDPCSDPTHDHLPGKYSLELKYDRLIDIAASARRIAPDLFVMWYWGLRSPFWALYGDTIFDGGYHLEGSGTSSVPTLFYRDSVTLAQDQAAQFAPNIPPVVKDSLGVWLAESRWGNFMGKSRWREAAVMDLGRGNLIFPNLWGNLYSFDAADVRFLARFEQVAKTNAALLARPRHEIGNVWQDEPYGYSYFNGCHGMVFMTNPHFDARSVVLRLDSSLAVAVNVGTPLSLVTEFPDRERIVRSDGTNYRAGERVVVWLRPFETLMFEVQRSDKASNLPARKIDERGATSLGKCLILHPAAEDLRQNVRFADAGTFTSEGLQKISQSFAATLPKLDGPQPILAVVVRLRSGGAEWKAPEPVASTQAMLEVAGHPVQLVPVPDGRQTGNTQHDGCSWIVYQVRLDPKWSGARASIAVHAYLPKGGSANVEGWVVKRWWQQSHRPQADGYYTYAPS